MDVVLASVGLFVVVFMALILYVWLLKRAWPGLAGLLKLQGRWSADETLRVRYLGKFWLYLAATVTFVVPGALWLVGTSSNKPLAESFPYLLGFFVYGITCILTVAALTFWMPLRWLCTHCGKTVSSREPWRCNRCNALNRGHGYYESWLWRCGQCKFESHVLLCPHGDCDEPIRLDSSTDDRHPATALSRVSETEDVGKTRTEEIAQKQHEIERLKHEAEIKRLEQQIARMNPAPPVDAKAMRQQKMEAIFEDMHFDFQIMAQSVGHRKKAVDQIEGSELSDDMKLELIKAVNERCTGIREQLSMGLDPK